MKSINTIVTIGALAMLTGCASEPTVSLLQPVGPAPAGPKAAVAQGSLEVYSAPQQEPMGVNTTDWWSDYNLNRSLISYGLAHTDYVILTRDGKDFQYVRNAKDPADPTPARVSLAPGRYEVKAEAERPDGTLVNVIIPIVIKPGKTTVVHLAGNWKPKGQFANNQVVRLPDGQIAGWLAAR